jgi:membrane protein YdbS with pleckstrin-like domain
LLGAKSEFGADAELKSLYRAYAFIILVGGFLWWFIPLAVVLWVLAEAFIAGIVTLAILLPVLVILAIALYWIPKFHSSIKYVLEEDEIVVEKGVWWKTKSMVPYNRITNVNIYQGPLSRRYGIGRLAVQTAGFSGVNSSGQKTAEADIIGIRNFEEIKDAVMSYVKGMKPVAVEAEAEPVKDINREVLEELRRIRKAVEK